MLLNTITRGSGNLHVALIHGASGDHTMYDELSELLIANGATVTAIDLRGHGESPRASSYALKDFVGDVVETLPTGLDVIIGHSLGALVLLESVATLVPGRAIYLDPPFLQIPPEVAKLARANISDADAHRGLGEHPDGTPFTVEELTEAHPGHGPANIERARASHSRWDASMLSAVTDIIFEPRNPALPQPVPSLIVLGSKSPFLEAVPVVAMRAAGFEVRVQPGVGHNIYLDDAQGTLTALEGWVRA